MTYRTADMKADYTAVLAILASGKTPSHFQARLSLGRLTDALLERVMAEAEASRREPEPVE